MRRWGKGTLDEIAGSILFFTLAGAAVFSLSCYAALNGSAVLHGKTKSDYLLMTVQCALGIAGMALPIWLDRKWQLHLPGYIFLLFYGFLFCAVFLGEMLSFYYRVRQWDTILHFFSGVMLCLLGFVVGDLLSGKENISPLLIAGFALCFSLALGAAWEIYEYVMDGLLEMNMQKFMDDGKSAFQGRMALKDTMEDLMMDAISAILTAGAGYVHLRRKKRAD